MKATVRYYGVLSGGTVLKEFFEPSLAPLYDVCVDTGRNTWESIQGFLSLLSVIGIASLPMIRATRISWLLSYRVALCAIAVRRSGRMVWCFMTFWLSGGRVFPWVSCSGGSMVLARTVVLGSSFVHMYVTPTARGPPGGAGSLTGAGIARIWLEN